MLRFTDTSSESCQTSQMKLIAVSYFCKTLHLRCLRGLSIQLTVQSQNSAYLFGKTFYLNGVFFGSNNALILCKVTPPGMNPSSFSSISDWSIKLVSKSGYVSNRANNSCSQRRSIFVALYRRRDWVGKSIVKLVWI